MERDSKQFYQKLNYKASEEFILGIKKVIDSSPLWEISYQFHRTYIPMSVLKIDPFVFGIVSNFNSYMRASIFRFDINTAVPWHTDIPRNCAVNMLVSGLDSLCLFAEDSKEGAILENVTSLEYEPRLFYAFNAEKKHSIINFSETRYLVSLGLPPEVRYNNLVSYMEKNNYIS